MANPKDWFRRRPASGVASAASTPPEPAPADRILELGTGARLLREPPPLASRPSAGAVKAHGAVPPPPPRPAPPQRSGPALDRAAFAVRPELSRAGVGTAFALRQPPAIPTPLARTGPEPRRIAEERREAEPARAPRPETPRAGGEIDAQQASFSIAAPGVSWKRARPATPAGERMAALLREAFTPTRPKQNATLFSGRFKQMQRIIAAIEEERAHVVLYGERGSGKTSLANVLALKAEDAGYFVLRFACSSETGFEDIFRSFLRRMPPTLLPDGIAATSRAGIDNLERLVPERFGVAELIGVLQRVEDKHVILIVDEYDRIVAEDTKAKFAELIKNMSDAGAPVTLLIIGVAENLRELIGKHPSLQRTVVAIPMPLMTRRELDGIIAGGEEKTGLTFEPAVREAIVDFAQGLPYHAQLLCLFAARNAVRRHSNRVEREDLRYAVQRSAEEADMRIKEAYDLAIGPHDNPSFRDVLFFAARGKCDEFGTFTPADVATAVAQSDPARHDSESASLLALQYPLKKLTEPERGAVLRRVLGPSGLRYQFVNQMLRHHVLIRQAEQRGLV